MADPGACDMIEDDPRIRAYRKGDSRVTTQNTSSTMSDKKDQAKDQANQAKDQVKEQTSRFADEMKTSAQKMGDQTRDAWGKMQENPTPSGIQGAIENLPAPVYLWATFGSIGLSLLLRLAGRKDFANFVGLWP